jgi:N-acylneuraminate cytidylyltransferase
MEQYNDKLVIIPARGGSKGVQGKNSKLLNGKPLIHYTIDAAREVADDEHICLSTDDPAIASLADSYGLPVPFMRPDALAADDVGTYEVLLHALEHYTNIGRKYSTIILLQPTSPARKGYHVKEALSLYSSDLDMVVSVKETDANPYYVLFEESENGFLEPSKKGNFSRRQDCPKVWQYNGAIYIINTASLQHSRLTEFKRIRKYVMDSLSSHEIDDELDWLVAENILKNLNP